MSRLIPLIAIIFAFAIGLLYIQPTFSGSINDTRQRIASYNSALEAADRFQQKEAELTQSRAQIPSGSLERLNAFLPNGVDNVQLILDMDALAARSGIILSEFDIDESGTDESATPVAATTPPATTPAVADPMMQPAPTLGLTSSSPVDSINLTFTATGPYTSFKSFLGAIETSLRPLDVINLTIDESDTGVYTYNVTVRIYWLR